MARREYARIGTDMPDEASVRACTVEELWLYDHALYLRPEMSRCGVVPFRPAVWAELATNATENKCRKWLNGLAQRRMVVVDEKYSEVFVRTFVRWDGLLGQPNVVANMVADFRVIASPTIRGAVLSELRRLWDLDSLTEGARGGWCLAMGHYPNPKTDRGQQWPGHLEAATLARLRKSIGTGLAGEMTKHIVEGNAAPFTEGIGGGIPEPFTQTPYAGACAGAIAVSAVSGSERRVRAPQPGGPDGPAVGEAADRAAAAHAHQLIDQTPLGPQSARTINGLRDLAASALTAGQPAAHVSAALTEWARRPGAGPGLLRNLLDDARNGHLPSNTTSTGPRSRAADTLALADRLEAVQAPNGATG